MKYNLINWDKADLSTIEGTSAVKRALEIKLADKFNKSRESHINYFTMRTDFPADGYPSLEQVRQDVSLDLGWQLAFKVIDFTNTNGAGGETGFDVAVAGSGLVLAAVPDGQKAQVYQAQGDSVRVPFVRFGGALLYINSLIEDGRWWDMEDNLVEAQNAYNNSIASTHYDLIDAMGAGINVAWQNPTPAALANTDPNYVISRDTNTINEAIIEIIEAAGGWQGINSATQFGIIAPIRLASRLSAAIAADKFGVKNVGFNVSIASTSYLANNDVYYVVPVQKAGRTGMRKALEIKFDENILEAATTMAVWGRWGSAILSDNVIRRCATA